MVLSKEKLVGGGTWAICRRRAFMNSQLSLFFACCTWRNLKDWFHATSVCRISVICCKVSILEIFHGCPNLLLMEWIELGMVL